MNLQSSPLIFKVSQFPPSLLSPSHFPPFKKTRTTFRASKTTHKPTNRTDFRFREDPIVNNLRTQLGTIHSIPSPLINKNILSLFLFFFLIGIAFDKIWTSTRKNRLGNRLGIIESVPDLQRKETVEWVNMVLGKLWKVYRTGVENWLVGLLQPVIDDLKKPEYVKRVEIKQFSLGEEPLSVRNVERKTSRRVNDLQYQIGLRYTGGARMLLLLSLSFSIIPIAVPVGVQDFDIDGELWVKLRLIPSEPWVGAVSWAFASLPKIKFKLSPFRLFNIMAIPVLSMFLTKLLTEDLPRLFVRPKKIVLDFQKGKAVGPLDKDINSGEMQDRNTNFVGELSVTLVDARKLSYIFYGKTDPYVIFSVGDQVICSKKNSQTTVIGPPGEPIWNQDFDLLVSNPHTQKLQIQVKDSLGFTALTIGTEEITFLLDPEISRTSFASMYSMGFSYLTYLYRNKPLKHLFCSSFENYLLVDLVSLKDIVPTDRIVVLRGGWGLFRKGYSGEILLRLTYKAYVEDEEDDRIEVKHKETDASDDELSDLEESYLSYQQHVRTSSNEVDKESYMNVLAAFIVSEEFQGIVASETGNVVSGGDSKRILPSTANSPGINSEATMSSPDTGSNGLGGSALFWLAVIACISVLTPLTLVAQLFFIFDRKVPKEFAQVFLFFFGGASN